MPTDHPVRKLGRQPFRRIPFAHLSDVQADAKLGVERDLRDAPTPLAGGMRKALHKELESQNSLRRRIARRYREPDILRTYGLLRADCPHCRHVMFFDEVPIEDAATIRCDRCRRLILA